MGDWGSGGRALGKRHRGAGGGTGQESLAEGSEKYPVRLERVSTEMNPFDGLFEAM